MTPSVLEQCMMGYVWPPPGAAGVGLFSRRNNPSDFGGNLDSRLVPKCFSSQFNSIHFGEIGGKKRSSKIL